MSFLDRDLRRKLESTVIKARTIAERAAKNALESLCVSEPLAPDHFDEKNKNLRKQLRAHGRLLGDKKDSRGRQEIDNLVSEIAYEHWHRMLFSRFLDANNLLMHPDGVPVSLAECEEIARESNISSKWIVAASYASSMLPQIFRKDSPALLVKLHPADRKELEDLIEELPEATFLADDSLGWVYQFWRSEEKDRVNKAEVKIGEKEISAVTQLFTENYMVQFLLQNSLGAWWKINNPGKQLNVDLSFLKTDENGNPVVQSSSFWPKNLSEFKLLDPCCGSGHFLTAAFRFLVELRMATEGLDEKTAADYVLRDNIHGLEIDPRCVEIAVFALALEAWKRGGYRQLPKIQVACCGKAPRVSINEWLKLADGDMRVENGLKRLYDLFANAPVYGSLINPYMENIADAAPYEEIWPIVDKMLQREDDEIKEMALAARGMADTIKILIKTYDLVITNVPYLSRGKQCELLRNYCESISPEGKNDLANVFLTRCLNLCKSDCGITQIVMPQNWLFLKSYQKQREKLLKVTQWDLLARLGEGGFDSSAAAGAFTILLTISKHIPSNDHLIHGLDASEPRNVEEKAKLLMESKTVAVKQKEQLENPDARISLEVHCDSELLSKYAYSFHGLTSGDMPRMKFNFWEIYKWENVWIPYQGTVVGSMLYGGNESLLRWENGEGAINELQGARKDGTGAWGKKGVLVSQMRELPVTLYNSYAFDNNTAVIVPYNEKDLPAIWCFCSSPNFNIEVRKIDQNLKVTNATLVKVPFDLEYWQKVAAEKYPNGLPKPYSDDPTQWIFHGHPKHSTSPLQVAVVRLLGYTWPAENDEEMELSDEARFLVSESKKLLSFADDDGIVCIPSVRGEPNAADRLFKLLEAAFGNDLNIQELIASTGSSASTLDQWLRNDFFTQHCALFKHRPFIWHIWDGERDGFSALVNYHKLNKHNLETLIYTYLSDWIARQKLELDQGEAGAQTRLTAALNLKERLQLILNGEQPYDIFVRWKPLEEQPLGWDPDLNDGVRINIRPFVTAQVLRYNKPPKLNIKWEKDRGKDTENSPWYYLFKGERINDHHTSLSEKIRARESSFTGERS